MVPTQDIAMPALRDAAALESPDLVLAAVLAAVLVALAFAVALALTALRRRDAD